MLKRCLICVLTAFMLSGCALVTSQLRVDELNNTDASGDTFTAQLAQEYRGFANREQSGTFDFFDAQYFAEKGLRAARGIAVKPEDPRQWRISGQALQDLIGGYNELVDLLNSGARTIVPQRAAIAQARFDCWVEQQEEAWQSRAITECRRGFERALDTAFAALDQAGESEFAAPLPPRPAGVQTVAARALRPMESDGPVRFLLFFEFGRSGLSDLAGRSVRAAAREAAGRRGARVTVTGYADRAGPKGLNKALSEKRADIVASALSRAGVPRDRISTVGRGENDPLVRTKDGTRNPANRRVEIVVR